jgi:hypothetical protein
MLDRADSSRAITRAALTRKCALKRPSRARHPSMAEHRSTLLSQIQIEHIAPRFEPCSIELVVEASEPGAEIHASFLRKTSGLVIVVARA